MKNFVNLAKAIVLMLAIILTNSVFAQTPANPSPIVGEEFVCVGGEYYFSTEEIEYAEVVRWHVPYGIIILDGHNTTEIVVYIDSMFTAGAISVSGWNRDFHGGKSVSINLNVRDLPFTPPPIIGEENVVDGETYQYEIHDIIGIGPYEWVVPEWMIIVEGQETNTIVVSVNGMADGPGQISVSAYNECGRSKSVIFKVNNVTGILDFESAGLSLRPNPVNGVFYVDGISAGTEIQIFDRVGKLIFTGRYDYKMDVSNLERGIYVVVITTDEYRVSKKIVKL